MPIITLTTDWNQHDYYLAVLKGNLLRQMPSLHIIDISHHIQSYNFAQAAFMLRETFGMFPEGTVHIVDVLSDYTPNNPTVLLSIDKQYIIAPDNGFFSLLLDERTDYKAYTLAPPPPKLSSFVAMGTMAPAALALLAGQQAEQLGQAHHQFVRAIPILPIIDTASISGHIIYIDSYGNAVTNISRRTFETERQGRDYRIYVQSQRHEIQQLSQHYQEVETGELLALFNSLQLLEIAVSLGNAAQLYSLSENSTIRIKFL